MSTEGLDSFRRLAPGPLYGEQKARASVLGDLICSFGTHQDLRPYLVEWADYIVTGDTGVVDAEILPAEQPEQPDPYAGQRKHRSHGEDVAWVIGQLRGEAFTREGQPAERLHSLATAIVNRFRGALTA